MTVDLVKCRNSSRVPVSTISPWRIITTLSANRSTSLKIWEDNKIALPDALIFSWKTCSIRGSRPDVGSSKIYKSESTDNAAINPTF